MSIRNLLHIGNKLASEIINFRGNYDNIRRNFEHYLYTRQISTKKVLEKPIVNGVCGFVILFYIIFYALCKLHKKRA